MPSHALCSHPPWQQAAERRFHLRGLVHVEGDRNDIDEHLQLLDRSLGDARQVGQHLNLQSCKKKQCN